ncbi:ead/Ea22-like family protein [Salmonella enterica subsp. diarizonae]|nr:ead/Ea22-like family protein [Salmonella enterica subsp. diarizonae]
MRNIDKQALRDAAGKVNSGDWSYEEFNRLDLPGGSFVKIDGRDAVYCLNKPVGGIKQSRAVIAFIATFNPKVALALLDELEVAEKHIENLSKAACVSSQWKPDVCPITGRMFFMWIEHETLGYVPTYGGPFDSYTIPTRDSDGEFSCERYDHDFGGWREGECIGLYLTDDDEQCRVHELEQHIAELESKNATVEMGRLHKRIAELEAKLANPVLLPKTNGYWNEQEKAYEEAITLAKRQVRLAGFSVEDM